MLASSLSDNFLESEPYVRARQFWNSSLPATKPPEPPALNLQAPDAHVSQQMYQLQHARIRTTPPLSAHSMVFPHINSCSCPNTHIVSVNLFDPSANTFSRRQLDADLSQNPQLVAPPLTTYKEIAHYFLVFHHGRIASVFAQNKNTKSTFKNKTIIAAQNIRTVTYLKSLTQQAGSLQQYTSII